MDHSEPLVVAAPAEATPNEPPKVAFLHYWLVNMRGGEKVLEALCELYPQADIFTHVYHPKGISGVITQHKISTTFIQRLPWPVRFYKAYLPLMPFAVESLDLQSYDLVISSEAGPMKAAITRPDALHICYCHSPMRYIWDQYYEYRRGRGRLARLAMTLFATPLRIWDTASASRVDHFIANSRFVAARIKKFYGRDATVINPPVATERFAITDAPKDYYLCFGQLVFYKRFDLAVAAFNQSGRRLLIAGTGEQSAALKKIAGPNISFLGRVEDGSLPALLANCRALIFPGAEDFGIIPVETMAAGRPVIAYATGGAAETIIDGKTGILFPTQTAASLNAAIDRFEAQEPSFAPTTIRRHAQQFDTATFKSKIAAFITSALERDPRHPEQRH
jgi:glycosyltransferase involved in cell wall biosynthesis